MWMPTICSVALNKDIAYKRDSSSPSLSSKYRLHDCIQYGGLSEQDEENSLILNKRL